MRCISVVFAVTQCLSVCPSVMFVDHVKMNKHVFEIFCGTFTLWEHLFAITGMCRWSVVSGKVKIRIGTLNLNLNNVIEIDRALKFLNRPSLHHADGFPVIQAGSVLIAMNRCSKFSMTNLDKVIVWKDLGSTLQWYLHAASASSKHQPLLAFHPCNILCDSCRGVSRGNKNVGCGT